MAEETMVQYALASAEAAYENPGEQAPMGFMASGGEIQGSDNTPPWMGRKCSSFLSLTDTENTNWETAAVHMSVAEDAIRKATGRFNTPVDCYGCINSSKYHADRFHTYRNCLNKRYPDVVEWSNQFFQEYAQLTSMEGLIMVDEYIQGQHGRTYSMAVRSMIAERIFQLNRSWKEEGFGSLYHELLMCEMMDPSTSRSVWVACAGALKVKYEIQNHKIENED